ncbi:hypothetical protein [Streptomyces griseosporeus]|uniref:hypothetical protein n=1 Tax=Streptomyces griseosporeus TaxID=1910 RepID=UPI00167DA9FA|nr:hypothetical protein [Streptomyces griseosporeus]GHF48125.1 hypothetical protein GCM10018783_16850 [Streptomyces griseosporeus]
MTRTQPGRPGDTAAPDDRVHQVVFRWAGNLGHRGAGIAAVAYSCPESEARALADRLGPVLRVMGGEQRPSLVRHILPGGRVLLVRRTPGSDAQGRDSTVCHALLGPAKLLVPLYCVSLGAVPWAERGWADRVTGRIEPMPRERLNALANHMRDRMWENVRLVRRPLLCLVAQFLRTPGARLSALVGELDDSLATAHAQAQEHRSVSPVQELPEPALLVLWGLWWIFGSSLDRGSGSWQFATFDTMDDQAYRVVFVPAWRVSPTEDSRLRRIDLLDPGTDLAAELAATLVDHYLHWPGVKYRRLLDTDPNTSDPVHRRFHARLREVWPARYEVPDTTDTGSVPVLSPPPARAPDRAQEPPPPQQPVTQDESRARPPARHTSAPAPAPAVSWTSPPEWRHQPPGAQGEGPVEATEVQWNGTETLSSASSPDGSTSATPQGTYISGRSVEPGQRTHSTRSGQGIHYEYPEPPSTPPLYPPPPNPPSPNPPPPNPPPPNPPPSHPLTPHPLTPNLPLEFSPRVDAPIARQATGHATGAGPGSAKAAPAIRAITDWLTPDHQRALRAEALPELFDQPVMGRSAVSKFRVHKGRRTRMDMSQIRALAEDLTCATNRAGHAADLRHKAEERLAHTHHEDLLTLLREPLPYAAQNIVLGYLPPAVPTEESARDLLTRLLAIDFRITDPPDPSDPYATDLHTQRTARMIRWFFSWLVEPRTTKTESLRLTRYLSSIASSDAPADHRILQELLIDTEEDRIPSLPKETWLAITRALYEKAHP